ncbi:MAG: endonuclease/exonuclease/phosphatase family protein [Planctomycetota bacterium]|nr:MAG: endonuclease/exonuclease/phosphatase family protein [Planctomycetota bacterium]
MAARRARLPADLLPRAVRGRPLPLPAPRQRDDPPRGACGDHDGGRLSRRGARAARRLRAARELRVRRHRGGQQPLHPRTEVGGQRGVVRPRVLRAPRGDAASRGVFVRRCLHPGRARGVARRAVGGARSRLRAQLHHGSCATAVRPRRRLVGGAAVRKQLLIGSRCGSVTTFRGAAAGGRAWVCALAVAAVLVGAHAPAAARSAPGRVRVMTFNIRFDFPSDGANRWRHRADAVAQAIRTVGADVVCLQEDKGDQVEDLHARLPGFGVLGRGRNATGRSERCSILYAKKRLRCLDTGSFWLSDTPSVPGSNTFGDKYPRVVTWALFGLAGKRRLLVLSLHLAEGRRGAIRRKGLEVVRDWLGKRLEAEARRVGERAFGRWSWVVCGDFNEDADAKLQRVLTGDRRLGLRDVWREVRPRAHWPGTYGGFEGLRTRKRIDWILVGGAARVLGCGKFEQKVAGRWPSDHYPVWADLALP